MVYGIKCCTEVKGNNGGDLTESEEGRILLGVFPGKTILKIHEHLAKL